MDLFCEVFVKESTLIKTVQPKKLVILAGYKLIMVTISHQQAHHYQLEHSTIIENHTDSIKEVIHFPHSTDFSKCFIAVTNWVIMIDSISASISSSSQHRTGIQEFSCNTYCMHNWW